METVFERNIGQGHPRVKTAREDRHFSITDRRNNSTTTSQLSCEVHVARETRISKMTVSRNIHERVCFLTSDSYRILLWRELGNCYLSSNVREIYHYGSRLDDGNVMARLVDEFLQSKDIRRTDWPVRSPDLIPIEQWFPIDFGPCPT
ncbi:uncharacterized protein TNCV_2375081 [Trichonephila clavipes]|nr:uncharacterized protein TNCV_2375081 [Trichonephila clavipes]